MAESKVEHRFSNEQTIHFPKSQHQLTHTYKDERNPGTYKECAHQYVPRISHGIPISLGC